MTPAPTRRSLIAAAATGLALPCGVARGGEPSMLAIESAVPIRHPAYGAAIGSLAARLAAATGLQVAVIASGAAASPGSMRLYHGRLAWGGASPFLAAELFGGFAFGMAPAELAAWIETPPACRLWHEGFAAAGLHALPCGVQASFGTTWWPAPIEATADLREVPLRARPCITKAAWGMLGVRHDAAGDAAGEDEAVRWASAASRDDRPGHDLPFAFGAVLDLAMPAQEHASLSLAMRRAIAQACAHGAATLRAVVAQGRPLPHGTALDLADAVSWVLPGIAGDGTTAATAFASYVDARRRMAWAG